jgi:predicted protein tyrosine phosphatase
MKLIVCPVLHVQDCVELYRPSHVLGLLAPGADDVPLPLSDAHRLELRFNDIAEKRDGLVAPEAAQIEALIRFSRGWDMSAPLLIYCFAGISRSTAAAFIIACQHCPSCLESDVAKLLRQVSPSATPNPLMVSLADALLERHGRMCDAIATIGRGEGYFTGNAFELDIEVLT